MNDVIAPKRSSLRSRLIKATIFLKLSMSLIPNNPANVAESLIWNTLIPSRLELLDAVDVSDDNKNEEDDNLSPMPVESEPGSQLYMLIFKPFNFLVQQHENTKPTKRNTTKYRLFGFV